MLWGILKGSKSVETSVDERSLQLIDEFADHWTEMGRKNGEAELASHWSAARSAAFEGWALQKIAGLQLAVEHLTVALSATENDLREEMKERKNGKR